MSKAVFWSLAWLVACGNEQKPSTVLCVGIGCSEDSAETNEDDASNSLGHNDGDATGDSGSALDPDTHDSRDPAPGGEADEETGEAHEETGEAEEETGETDEETGEADEETGEADEETGETDDESHETFTVDEDSGESADGGDSIETEPETPEVDDADTAHETDPETSEREDTGRAAEPDTGVDAHPHPDTGKHDDSASPELMALAFVNPSFEDDATGWDMVSGVRTIDPTAEATSFQTIHTGDPMHESTDRFVALDGAVSLKMWGLFWGRQSFMYANQTFPAAPGAVIRVDAEGWHHRDDAIINPTTYGAIKVQFLDRSGRVLVEHLSNTINHETPTDTWTSLTVTATAPYGTESMRVGPFHLHCEDRYSDCWDPGATYFDALNIEHVAHGSPAGAFVFGNTGTATAIIQSGQQFFMLRSGEAFTIHGLSMGNVTDTLLTSASARGANAIRTYSLSTLASDLEKAETHGMGVFAGHWLSHDPALFHEESYRDAVRTDLIEAIEAHKDSPALLGWVLGNEMNLSHSATDMAAGWECVEELAQLIHELDPDHPVMTVLAGTSSTQVSEISAMVPSVDILGMNAYGGIYGVGSAVNDSTYEGPFMVTEWGVNGFWEMPSTEWDRPIEETSAEKRSGFSERYTLMQSWDGFMGNFAFLWGFKQERTPTWFSITVEDDSSSGRPDFLNGEFTGIADVLQTKWTGSAPANLAPDFSAIRVNGEGPTSSVVLTGGTSATAEVDLMTHGETDSISYYWELVVEIDPALYGLGGSAEPRPETHTVFGPFSEPTLTFTVPTDTSGSYNNEYRLFAYGFDAPDADGRSRVATANIPIRIAP